MSSLGHLVQMANQIATFHAALPDHTEAVNGVAAHLRRFREPRMRATLLEHLEDPACAALHPLVREAIATHSDDLRPASPR